MDSYQIKRYTYYFLVNGGFAVMLYFAQFDAGWYRVAFFCTVILLLLTVLLFAGMKMMFLIAKFEPKRLKKDSMETLLKSSPINPYLDALYDIGVFAFMLFASWYWLSFLYGLHVILYQSNNRDKAVFKEEYGHLFNQ